MTAARKQAAKASKPQGTQQPQPSEQPKFGMSFSALSREHFANPRPKCQCTDCEAGRAATASA